MKKIVISMLLVLSSTVHAQQYGHVALAYGLTQGDTKASVSNSYGLDMGFGYAISRYFGLGVNTKLMILAANPNLKLDVVDGVGIGIAAAISPRINFIDSDYTPFVYLDAGYARVSAFYDIEAKRTSEEFYKKNNTAAGLSYNIPDIPKHGIYFEPTVGMKLDWVSFAASYAKFFNKASMINLKVIFNTGDWQSGTNKRKENDQKKKLEELDRQMEQQQETRKLESKSSTI